MTKWCQLDINYTLWHFDPYRSLKLGHA